MAVDDCNLDAEDLIFDNIEKGYCGISESDHWLSESQKSQLCVPPDPIEDLDWFPTFPDDFISLNDVGLTLRETQSYCFVYDKPNQSPENLTFMDSPVTVIPEPQHENEFKAKQQSKEEEVMNLKDQNHNEMRKKARMKNYHKPKRAVTWVKKRCGHCHAEETPQWRTGPLGPKTLCNACGVRFKSGRLVPEYRPATSPTFDSSRHSNYHRNIMKMRS